MWSSHDDKFATPFYDKVVSVELLIAGWAGYLSGFSISYHEMSDPKPGAHP